MKLEKLGVLVGIVAGVVAIWYYLRDTPDANLVTYPNTQASGQPASNNVATTYNIAAPSPLPSPNLIYGQAPPLPQAPAYQTYNYSPINLLGLTSQGAAMVPLDKTAGMKPKSSDSCGCQSSCGCGSCSTGGQYQDGNQQSCLVANPAEQVSAGHGAMYVKMANNIMSSTVGPDAGQPLTPNSTPNPISDAARYPTQAQGITQGQASVNPNYDPGLSKPFLTWLQFEALQAINPGVM